MKNLSLDNKYGDKAECPGCSGEVVVDLVAPGRFVKGTCRGCGGLVGHYAKYETSWEHVKNGWAVDAEASARQVYFDQTWEADVVFTSGRRHGWFDPATRLVVQLG